MSAVTAAIPPDAFRLFDEPNLAHFATVMPDGTPQVSPVWVERDGDRTVLLNTAKGRVKHRNAVRRPDVALAIHDRNDPYTYVQVRGRAEMVDEGADDHIHRLSHKYLGKPYPPLPPGEERVIVRVSVGSVRFRNVSR